MPMEVIQTGVGAQANIQSQVDPTHQAARTNARPLEHVVAGVQGGHYAMVATFSSTAAKPAGGSDIFSLRWTSPNYLLVLKRFYALVLNTTGYTATAGQDIALFVARNFTASPSGGTQVIPLAGGQAVRSSNMKKSGLDGSLGVVWISSGDLLTVGTRTLDTQPIGAAQWVNPISTGTLAQKDATLYEQRDLGQHPIVLGANEGLVVQTPIGNAQAAGVSKFAFGMEWAEVAAY